MGLEISKTANISKLSDIEESSRGTRFVVGDNSMIDSFVKVKTAGGEGHVFIGDRVYINSGCVLYTGNGISIGNGSLIAANCVFAPVNHGFKAKDKTILEQGFLPSKGGIIIEEDVWIGAGCTILDGTIIRKGAVIGAMSLIRGEIPEYTIWGGNPLVKMGMRE